MRRLLPISLLIAGCVGEIPETKRYLLRTEFPNHPEEQKTRSKVVLGTLSIAPYIDRLGLVVEAEDGTVRSARYHLWAEPLRESLRVFLANEVAKASGQAVRFFGTGETYWRQDVETVIELRIDQLHGAASGDAILVAYWAIVDPVEGRVKNEFEFSGTQPLSVEGYAALVQAEKALLRKLADRIAATL